MTSTVRTIAIGDIHGCSRALRELLLAVQPCREDRIIVLGDVVDRGPDAKGVVELLLQLQSHCNLLPILGNHEEMMLKVYDGGSPERWIYNGGMDTLDSYGFCGSLDVVPAEHIAFLRTFVDYAESASHFFVHANYNPHRPLDEQERKDLRWRSLKGHVPGPHMSGKTAIVGHTANELGNVVEWPHLKCIDTCCYGGGWLTAYDIRTQEVWQANEQGDVRSFVLEQKDRRRTAG